MRAIVARGTVLLLLATQSFSLDTPPKNKARTVEWERLVSEAQVVSRNFSPEERADLLLDIIQIPANTSPDKTKQWSLEDAPAPKPALRGR